MKQVSSLTGILSGQSALFGKVSAQGGLRGVLSPAAKEYPVYEGEYRTASKAFDPQTLPTKGKLLTEDIIIDPVPYYETGNLFDGTTVYIAERG